MIRALARLAKEAPARAVDPCQDVSPVGAVRQVGTLPTHVGAAARLRHDR